MADDLLYGILLADQKRHVITRKTLSVVKNIQDEYDDLFKIVNEHRQKGCICYRVNSSWSNDLEGSRDENDSLLQGMVFNVLIKNRRTSAVYFSSEFQAICRHLGSVFAPPTLDSGNFYGADSVVIGGL
jgi:hypothetical protein